MTFAQAVTTIVKTLLKKNQRRGKAINIDLDKCVCDVDLGNETFLYDVKLKAIEAKNDKGIVIVPKDKSYVVAAMVEGVEADWCLVQWSEIDSCAFFFKQGGKVELKDNGEVHLNGDNKGALVVIQNLVDKINALENKMTNHQHSYVSPTGPAITNSAGTQEIVPTTTVNDLKNDKVKHGG